MGNENSSLCGRRGPSSRLALQFVTSHCTGHLFVDNVSSYSTSGCIFALRATYDHRVMEHHSGQGLFSVPYPYWLPGCIPVIMCHDNDCRIGVGMK